jgi:hypothetical protein
MGTTTDPSSNSMKPRPTMTVLGTLALAGALLPGCTIAAGAGAMVPDAALTPACSSVHALGGALAVGTVGGGSETSSWGVSKVSDASLADALRTALEQRGMAADTPSSARFRLDVHLIELNQPQAGFTTEVVTFIRYKLVTAADNTVAYDDVIQASHVLDYGDVFVGSKRMRIVTEGSVARNIAAFLDDLCSRAASGSWLAP